MIFIKFTVRIQIKKSGINLIVNYEFILNNKIAKYRRIVIIIKKLNVTI